jgi:hypothetical protein
MGHVSTHMLAAGKAEKFIPEDASCTPYGQTPAIVVNFREADGFVVKGDVQSDRKT